MVFDEKDMYVLSWRYRSEGAFAEDRGERIVGIDGELLGYI
jgi:hypothetical protein